MLTTATPRERSRIASFSRRPAPDRAIRHDGTMDALHEGQKIWVEQTDGSQRAGIFVGEAEGTWFGGGVGAYVVYPDTKEGEQVALMRVVPRED
jgi:hypothetical protein